MCKMRNKCQLGIYNDATKCKINDPVHQVRQGPVFLHDIGRKRK